jgi:hypothetical protein
MIRRLSTTFGEMNNAEAMAAWDRGHSTWAADWRRLTFSYESSGTPYPRSGSYANRRTAASPEITALVSGRRIACHPGSEVHWSSAEEMCQPIFHRQVRPLLPQNAPRRRDQD